MLTYTISKVRASTRGTQISKVGWDNLTRNNEKKSSSPMKDLKRTLKKNRNQRKPPGTVQVEVNINPGGGMLLFIEKQSPKLQGASGKRGKKGGLSINLTLKHRRGRYDQI